MNYLVTLQFFWDRQVRFRKIESEILGQINSRPRKVGEALKGKQELED